MSDTPIRPRSGGSSTDPAEAQSLTDRRVAHPARVYDALLSGKDNYAVDREVAAKLLKLIPHASAFCHRNREFIGRVVRYLVGERGIDQIVDIGAGIPTAPAVHQMAREVNPAVRVAYIDNDPAVLAYDRALLATEDGVVAFHGDLLDPASVLDYDEIAELIDWNRPVAVLFAAVLHFVTDDQDPDGIMRAYRERLAPGSAIAISHDTSTGNDPETVRRAEEVYTASTPLKFRPRERIAEFFAGFDVVDPGVVKLHEWRPNSADAPTDGGQWGCAGVGALPSG